MAVHRFSDAQVHKARHALGLTRQKTAYRNYYAAEGDADWDDLVARGFAVKVPPGIYRLTKEAAFFFLDPGESVADSLLHSSWPQGGAA